MKHWTVSDRKIKPQGFHVFNEAAVLILVFCALLLLVVALLGWVSVPGLF
jgi:hypothetical protein